MHRHAKPHPTRPPAHLRLRFDPDDHRALNHALRVLERWLRLRLAALARDPGCSAQDEVDAELQAESLRDAARALWIASGRARAELATALGIELARLGAPRDTLH